MRNFVSALSPRRCSAMANCLKGGSSSSAQGNLTPSTPGIFNARSCLHLGEGPETTTKTRISNFFVDGMKQVFNRVGANFLRMFQLIRTQWIGNPAGFHGIIICHHASIVIESLEAQALLQIFRTFSLVVWPSLVRPKRQPSTCS